MAYKLKAMNVLHDGMVKMDVPTEYLLDRLSNYPKWENGQYHLGTAILNFAEHINLKNDADCDLLVEIIKFRSLFPHTGKSLEQSLQKTWKRAYCVQVGTDKDFFARGLSVLETDSQTNQIFGWSWDKDGKVKFHTESNPKNYEWISKEALEKISKIEQKYKPVILPDSMDQIQAMVGTNHDSTPKSKKPKLSGDGAAARIEPDQAQQAAPSSSRGEGFSTIVNEKGEEVIVIDD